MDMAAEIVGLVAAIVATAPVALMAYVASHRVDRWLRYHKNRTSKR